MPVSVASPGVDGSWEFRGRAIPDGDRVVPGLDSANGCKTVREVYKLALKITLKPSQLIGYSLGRVELLHQTNSCESLHEPHMFIFDSLRI